MKDLLTAIEAIEDPVERFKAAADTIELARTTLMVGARQIRQNVVNAYREQGMGLGEVAKHLGQTRSRVQQISEGRTGGKARAADPAKRD